MSRVRIGPPYATCGYRSRDRLRDASVLEQKPTATNACSRPTAIPNPLRGGLAAAPSNIVPLLPREGRSKAPKHDRNRPRANRRISKLIAK